MYEFIEAASWVISIIEMIIFVWLIGFDMGRDYEIRRLPSE